MDVHKTEDTNNNTTLQHDDAGQGSQPIMNDGEMEVPTQNNVGEVEANGEEEKEHMLNYEQQQQQDEQMDVEEQQLKRQNDSIDDDEDQNKFLPPQDVVVLLPRTKTTYPYVDAFSRSSSFKERAENSRNLIQTSFIILIITTLGLGLGIGIGLSLRGNDYKCTAADQFKDKLGDGQCDFTEEANVNNEACEYDGGDCIAYNQRVKRYPWCSLLRIDGRYSIDIHQKWGDGKCDRTMNPINLNTQRCGYDDGDCDEWNAKYDQCKPGTHASKLKKFGISSKFCNQDFNTEECGYDDGGCLYLNENYPGCKVETWTRLGDGICDYKEDFLSEECAWDGGDCNMILTKMEQYPDCWGLIDFPEITFEKFGDGTCDHTAFYLNSDICGFDDGDCEEFNDMYEDCKPGKQAWELESFASQYGICNQEYNTPECGFDNGNCIEFNEKYPECKAPYPLRLNDGWCDRDDPAYNTAECGWDGGDCINSKYPNCTDIDISLFFNSRCDQELNREECGFDDGKCSAFNAVYPNCKVKHVHLIGNGLCHNYDDYNTEDCGFDGGDCTDFNKNYTNCTAPVPHKLGNGFCDNYRQTYNSEACKFDGGDCTAFNDVYPLCDVYDTTRIGNGYCANLPDINNAACGFDGGDCQAFNENITYAECKVIDASRLGDGFCDGFLSEDPTQFNSEACVYDGGDCLLLNKYPNCSLSWFSTRRFGDGTCDELYGKPPNTPECGFDGGDCTKRNFPDCEDHSSSRLGDGYCDQDLNLDVCGFDGGDCL